MTTSAPSTPDSPATGFSPSAFAAGLLAALVGYASSVALVVQGIAGAGANREQITSGLVAIGIALGLSAILLSWRSRLPISIAWTTPGVALLATTGPIEGGFPAAVGAFIVTGLLIMLAGFWTPLGRWVAAIPKPLASAMLAGILLKLCLAPFVAVTKVPETALLVLATWVVVGRFARLYAVPAAVLVALGAMMLDAPGQALPADLWPRLTFVAPVFTLETVIGLSVPLFIVTMASQNIPGLTVLASYGFHPRVGPPFLVTGAASSIAALFGSPAVNFAAITAAICAGPDADPNPARRWQAAAMCGVGHLLLTGLAAVTATVVTQSPPILIEAVAGLALIGAFGSAMLGAVQSEEYRTPAVMTLLVTASGLSLFGIGSAFWGLLLGGGMYLLHRPRPSPQPAAEAAE
ncbi:benzoate/H(+) symporter BenE family transporter [Azospirillum sp. SYSU D00513]|uniref:benzoate/H(+) symporter BenE family transporter n=1 Tax=Azospirillum sp. SYSU D00513 TaxID=2812561 RepID=UPI001A95E43C|nr:benzoate/H(+) symporter BenE family transporter [Azospirillum sp. SYSU D00513]